MGPWIKEMYKENNKIDFIKNVQRNQENGKTALFPHEILENKELCKEHL